MPKVSKAAAHYTPNGSASEHCAICQHFISLPNPPAFSSCSKVSGPISPHGWSKFFQKKAGI